jgi:hypothetical protein
MWGAEENVRHRTQGRAYRQGFWLHDVQAGDDVTAAEPSYESVGVDDRTARHVDEHASRAEGVELARTDHPPCGCR